MGHGIHQDEQGLFLGKVQHVGIGGWLPSEDMVLDFPVVEGLDESFDKGDLSAILLIGVGQLV